ncbi:MAG TPA: hypothetical protein VFS07_01135, partial [Gemmatimonadales bacterium]|nr:hypothetical protein [Gemmatimonadales bacterium]
MTARRWLAHAVACTLLLAPRPLRAQRGWRPEDRTVIGSMLHVYAVAADAQRLYVVTAGQVLIRDELRREWQGPFTGPQLGQVQEVRGGLVDLFDRSLWLVTGTGWLRYDPTLDLWEQGFAGASILGAGLDRNAPLDGLYLRTPSGWMLAQRGGGVLPAPATPRGVDLLRPVTVADAVQANPQLQL